MDLYSSFDAPVPTIVLAEGEFGQQGGKTANGVVIHSELFEAQAVIDSTTADESSVDVLGKAGAPDVPIVSSFAEAKAAAPDAEVLVIGVAPAGGQLPEEWTEEIQAAMQAGCDIVSGLHVFLGDEPEWRSLADECEVRIFDVRKPPLDSELRVGDGRVDDLDADIVLTMGTDCAVGKRTTTFELYKAACEAGYDAGWVATGQTGLMVGAQRGVVIDRVPADFAAGVVEDQVCAVAADHDLVFVEGQASLTHRAYSSVTLSVLHGSWPDAVVIADDPNRSERSHFAGFTLEGVEAERELIESLSDATVAGISTWGTPEQACELYDLPAGNVYHDDGAATLFDAVTATLTQ